MIKKSKILNSVFVLFTLVFALFFLIYTYYDEYVPQNTTYQDISLIGQIEFNDSIQDFNSSTFEFENIKASEVFVKGRFDKENLQSYNLNFLISRIDVEIFINEKRIFSYTKDTLYPQLQTTGDSYQSVLLDKLDAEDIITISLSNCNQSLSSSRFNVFFNKLSISQNDDLFFHLWGQYKITFGISISILGIAILFLLTIIFLRISKHKFKVDISFALMVVFGSSWLLFDLNFELFNYLLQDKIYFAYLLNYLPVFILPFILFVFVLTLVTSNKLKRILSLFYIAWVINFGCIFLQFIGFTDLENLQEIAIIPFLALTVLLFFFIFANFKKDNKKMINIFLSCIPGCLGGIIQCITYFVFDLVQSTYFAVGFSISILFLIYSYAMQVKTLIDAQIKEKTLEKKLANEKINIMLSQIQPHFLFNTLLSIKSLCDINPKQAKTAIDDFSIYLRGNLDSLGKNLTIPFTKEMKHVNHYLSLEKMRFEERLNVVFDIQVENFDIPPLSIQPLVENAIQYGVTKRKEGGTIYLKTYEDELYIYIEIKDDGVGFNIKEPLSEEKSHIGLKNVESRIAQQLQGTLSISSIIDVGTTVQIKFLKKCK